MASVLIVDDEEMDRFLESTVVEDAGHKPYFAGDGEAALKVYEEHDIDVVVTDLQMPNVDGLRLIQELLGKHPNAAIIAVSGAASSKLPFAIQYGAVAALEKPVDPQDLMDAIQEVITNRGNVPSDASDVWGGPRVLSVTALFFLTVLASPSLLHAQTRPNVVFIMTDDVGYGDLGSYGGPDIRTPNLDQLANDGVRFTDFYANAPACTPTRAGFVTGRYQQRVGMEAPMGSARESFWGGLVLNARGLEANGRTLPQLLKNSGYATGLVGKWHLGYKRNQSPGAHGFDYFYGFKSGYVDYYQHTNGQGASDLWENEERIDADGYLTDLITDRSVDFIHQNAGRPFFLSVQYNAAHWPYQPPDMLSVARRNAAHLQPHSEDTSTREDYIAMLERADQGIGAIVQAIADAGLTENTLVVFTNDNGGEWLSRNAPLFNRKGTVCEGGIRVPAIMAWPGVIPAGPVTGQVGITMDVTATILAATGASVPTDLDLDGINLLPILTGEAPEVERTLFWRATGGIDRAVRSGDWKLLIQDVDWGRASFVFNVQDDPGERNDLSNIRQDVARRLRGLLDEWVADVEAEAKAGGSR